jgi:hypothetical protein
MRRRRVLAALWEELEDFGTEGLVPAEPGEPSEALTHRRTRRYSAEHSGVRRYPTTSDSGDD